MIVTLTMNSTIDKTCEVAQVVAEFKLRCGIPKYYAGGGGINVARAIRRLNGDAHAIWTQGGPTGQRLQELLDREGVKHTPIPVHGQTRENLIVFESTTARHFRFCMPGHELHREELQACTACLSSIGSAPAYLVISGSMPPGLSDDDLQDLFNSIPSSTRTIVDTSGSAMHQILKRSVYMIKPNLRELEQLAGQSIENNEQIRSAARTIIQKRQTEIVLTSVGAQGAILSTEQGHWQFHSPTVKTCCRVGAGDSMVAGTVVALSQGQPIVEAVRYGVAAGTAAVLTEGTELCGLEDTEALFQDMSSEDLSHWPL
ncbi:putative phosphofructokinase PfkB [Rubinisphaera italica]|uniref:Putative phosphofructokinase PfkB n=2 Tax=Rubinisphaera italica TaxID=2527969 RepID=A0A5C5XDJ1_9PLAN|nr:putative phosphofructokinase PfkB [Rubinisphaera italica]